MLAITLRVEFTSLGAHALEPAPRRLLQLLDVAGAVFVDGVAARVLSVVRVARRRPVQALVQQVLSQQRRGVGLRLDEPDALVRLEVQVVRVNVLDERVAQRWAHATDGRHVHVQQQPDLVDQERVLLHARHRRERDVHRRAQRRGLVVEQALQLGHSEAHQAVLV